MEQQKSYTCAKRSQGSSQTRRSPLPCLLPLLVLPLLLLCMTGCHEDEADPTVEPSQPRRTVLVYMAAQNSMGSGNYHLTDSTEIMNARQHVSDNDRLLLFIDDSRAPRLYQVTKDAEEPTPVRQWDTDFCSTDPQSLQAVLELVRTDYETDEYGLVMWSHADGWIPATDTDYGQYGGSAGVGTMSTLSFGIDCGTGKLSGNNGAQMNVEDMAAAIAASGMHCTYIFFDACLMQNLEVAYALRNVTDYVIASPAAIPGAGSYYTHQVQEGLFSDDPADIARVFLEDVTAEELQAVYTDYGLAISCIRTDKLQALADALYDALPYSTLMNRQSPDLSGILAYQTYTPRYHYRPHNYDALQALRLILPTEKAEAVEAAMDEAVVYHGATPTIWTGPGYYQYIHVPVGTGDYRSVSLFVPQAVYTENASKTKYGDLNEAFRQTAWYKAIGMERTGW